MRRNSFASFLLVLVVGIVILALQLLDRAGICSWAQTFNTESMFPAVLLIAVGLYGVLLRRGK